MNTCPICSRSYKRPEHLRRHLQSHSTDRPYTCSICGSTFQRTDVLRRHQQTCSAPSTAAHHDLEPSAKRVALSPAVPGDYDGLADYTTVDFPGLKGLSTIHDQGQPSLDHIAGWVVSATSDSPEIDIWQEFLNTSSGTFTPGLPEIDTVGSASSLGFLDNFTRKSGLTYSFDCGTDVQRQDFALSGADTQLQAFTNTDQLEADPSILYSASTSVPQWLSDPLSFKSHEIMTGIKDTILNKPKQSCVTLTWSSAVQDTCLRFFSPSNIRRYLELYWALWHPNVNIIHRPTFDTLTSKAYLIAAMCLIGASVSPNATDSAAAKLWFNCVEELVFTSDDLCDDTQLVQCRDTGKNRWRRDHLRALQAAYIVLLYQNWDGTDASKRRIRRLRFSTVVAVVRDVGIPNAFHQDYSKEGFYNFSWADFAATEELVRVVLWVFLVDTAFVIFNNLPPRMVITEMVISPASPESCFQASTAEECYSALTQAHPTLPPNTPPRFSTLFEKLYTHPPTTSTTTQLANLGPLNLFAMTSALHSLVFHHRSSFSSHGSLTAINHALTNWHSAWRLYRHSHAHTLRHNPVQRPSTDLRGPDMWRRLGFARHAEEYWHLAKLMVEHDDLESEQGVDGGRRRRSLEQDEEGVGEEGMDMHLRGDGDTAPTATTEGDVASTTSKGHLGERLRNYDETSMRQINELIADFRRAEI